MSMHSKHMLTLAILLAAPLVGSCGEDATEEATTRDTSCFWCVGGDTADTSAVDGSEAGDTGKDYDDYEVSDSWTATISTDLSNGYVEYTHSGAAGASCTLEAELTELATIESCDDCDFAMAMSHGAPEITMDKGACDEVDDLYALEGADLAFGQGQVSYGEYGGIEYFDLQGRLNGDWSAFDEGYSAVYSNAGEDYWFFGVK